MRRWLFIVSVFLSACTQLPEGIQPVNNFDLQRYLGTWYEIARLDHSFERGLSRVTAQYSARDDGGIAVLNRGYSESEQAWEEAEGKAYFVEESTLGHLKVSFFGPFYSSYVIFELDDNYQYALVSGYNRSYFWILARTPTLDRNVLNSLTTKAKDLGFDSDALIYVQQQPIK